MPIILGGIDVEISLSRKQQLEYARLLWSMTSIPIRKRCHIRICKKKDILVEDDLVWPMLLKTVNGIPKLVTQRRPSTLRPSFGWFLKPALV